MHDIKLYDETESTSAGLPALTIDWERYRQYLEGSDLSDEQARAFIEALWSIMVSFVDLGFRINPVQEICGEVRPLDALAREASCDMLGSNGISQHTENPEKADGALQNPLGDRSPK